MAGKGDNPPLTFSFLSLDPPAPSPESSPCQYTPAKIKERLDYAERMGKRDLPPRSEIFLQLYKDAAENALEVVDDADRLAFCKRLHLYDRFIQENSFLCREPTPEQRELQGKLVKLKQLEYYLRYGDYLGRK